MAMKRCSKCGDDKPLEEYHRSPSSRDGRMSRCKECRIQDSRDYSLRRQRAEATAEQRGRALETGADWK
jgi:hypothetical protein